MGGSWWIGGLLLAVIAAAPATAQTESNSEARAHMAHVMTAARQVSSLAKEKIRFNELIRDHAAVAKQLRNSAQADDWSLCVSPIESAMGQVVDRLEFLTSLESLTGDMETPDDRKAAARQVSLYAFSTQNAVEWLGITVKGAGASCRAQEDFTGFEVWIAEIGPVLAEVKQTADEGAPSTR